MTPATAARMAARSAFHWTAYEVADANPTVDDIDALLPPDLTLPTCRESHWCNVQYPVTESEPWRLIAATCTRRRGHTGRHAAGDGEVIYAVWGDR